MIILKAFRSSIPLIALAIIVAGCGQPATRSTDGSQVRPAGPKRMVAALRGDPFTLNDRINTAGAGSIRSVERVEKMLTTGLGIEDEGVIHPRLAETIPSAENGLWQVFPDGRMTTTWRLRRDAVWHDGTPFTPADVVFTGQVGRDKALTFANHPAFDLIDSVDAPDAQTVVAHWSKPFIQADQMFSSHVILFPLPRHLLEKPFLEDKESFTQLPFWTEGYVGTGPFKLKEWVRSSYMVVEANDRYVMGRPKLDLIEIRFMADPNAMAASLLAGEVDLTLAALSVDQGMQIRDRWANGTMVATPSTTTWIAIWPQLLTPNPPVIGDVRFRRALLHALDRQEITEVFNAGLSPVAHSPIHPERPEYVFVERSITRYDYDPRRAVEIIESLGYVRGTDGAFRASDTARDGPRLTLEIRATATDDAQLKPAFSVADYWQRIGIATEPVPVPPQRAVDRAYRSNFPGFEVVRQSAEVARFGDFRSSETPLAENNYTGKNRTRYANAEYDALVDRVLSTIPLEERMQVLSRLVQHQTENVVIMGLFFNVGATMVSNRLGPTSAGDVWRVHEWDVIS